MRVHQDRVPLARGPIDCRNGRRRHPYGRVRRLQWLGQHLDTVIAKEPTLVRQTLLGPGLQHDLHRLMKARTAFLTGYLEGREFTAFKATAGAPVDAAP